MEETEPQNHGTNQNGTEAVTQHPKKILKKIRKWFKNWRSNWAGDDGDVRDQNGNVTVLFGLFRSMSIINFD